MVPHQVLWESGALTYSFGGHLYVISPVYPRIEDSLLFICYL
jgi:hypothetical protein